MSESGSVAVSAEDLGSTTWSSTLTRGDDLPRPRCLPPRGSFGVVPLSIPLGLISGRPFRPFSRAISSRCSATIRLRSATSPSSFNTSCCSSPCDRPDISGGMVTSSLNQAAARRRKQNISSRPRFCPITEKSLKLFTKLRNTLPTGLSWNGRLISHEKVYVRASRIKIRTASSRAEHVQSADMKPPADVGNVVPSHFDQWQHDPMVHPVTLHTLPQPPGAADFGNCGCQIAAAGSGLHRPAAAAFRKLSIEIIGKRLIWGLGVVGSNPAAPTN